MARAESESVTPKRSPDTSSAPFVGVDSEEWGELLVRGHASGEVHAEQLTHVLRHVELTGDVLEHVQAVMAEEGIRIDDAVDSEDDETPPSIIREVLVEVSSRLSISQEHLTVNFASRSW